MSTGRTFALLVALGLVGLGAPVVLALHFSPCLAVGSICLLSSVDATCRLLGMAGLLDSPTVLGPGLLLVAALTVGRVTWSVGRQVRATRRLVAGLLPSLAVAERCRLVRAARRVGIPQRVDLVGGEPRSFCHGFMHPRVAVSEGLVRSLKPAQLEAVLWHERHHLECRDPLRLLLGRALRDGLVWLPLLGAIVRHFELLVEVVADRRAVVMQSGPVALAGALYRLISAGRVVPAAAAVASLSLPMQRVDYLLDPTRQPRLQVGPWALFTAVGLTAIAFCLLFL